jgi:urea transport system permease protein
LKRHLLFQALFAAALCFFTGVAFADSPRETIAKAIVTEETEEQAKLITTLVGKSGPEVVDLLKAWKEGSLYIFEQKKGDGDDAPVTRIPVTLEGNEDSDGRQKLRGLASQQIIKDAKGRPVVMAAGELTQADTDGKVRTAMKAVLDLAALSDADPAVRRNAVTKLGMAQDPANVAILQQMAGKEPDAKVRDAIREAINLIELKSEDPAKQISAAKDLAKIGSIPSQDFIEQMRKDAPVGSQVAKAAEEALASIKQHTQWVDFYGTLFRGASLASVLLVVAIGLAITFGLMGVINMAHGELIAVGAYTTYIVQGMFGGGVERFGIPGLHYQGAALDSYFLFAIPASFLTAAIVGIVLERGIIRFLYRRPLESLLATWGVSLVLQQVFRLVFGANNVQVYSPSWLSGNWTFFDVIFGWNRVFVIGFAILIVVGTHLLLTKTPLGLLIRAAMQNRVMAANVGVRTERVNMLTFGFGSGLAGLAGAFLSQIGNVGPSMGQDHIVNAFMTVVVGGVGSLAGTVLSAIGIGVSDQSLQQILGNPVLGKILVLGAIILFLQWRPAGLFVTKSRSLES